MLELARIGAAALEDPPIGFAVARVAKRDVQGGNQCRDRRAQLMRCIADELIAKRERLL